MPVKARIKILECKNFKEVENKVNDFLASDKDIAQLVGIDYRLEYSIVIVEYYVSCDCNGNGEENGENNNKKLDNDYNMMSMFMTNPFAYWYRLFYSVPF